MKNKERDSRKLQREREKLNRLVDEALANGTPIAQTYEIMKQSRKVRQMASRFGSKGEECK